MRIIGRILIVLFLCLTFPSVQATHLVGSHISYRGLGNNVIEITLRVYRDCYNGIPGFDAPAYISIFNSDSIRIKDLPVYVSNIDTMDVFPVDTCVDTSIYNTSSFCYEVGTYVVIDTLPATNRGFYIIYDRCCLPQDFTNIYQGDLNGTSVMLYIRDTAALNHNQSPTYDPKKIDLACTWIYNTIDNAFSELDGDSVHYSLVAPLRHTKPNPNSHNPPTNPAYQRLLFYPGYSASNPFGGYPPVMDEDSGILEVGPVNIGGFLYGIKLDEYRNGVHLGYSEVAKFVYSVPYGTDTSDTIDGISEEWIRRQIKIYPNPTYSEFTLEIPKEMNATSARLLSAFGREIRVIKIDELTSFVDLSELPNGVYYLQIIGDKAQVTRSVIKISS